MVFVKDEQVEELVGVAQDAVAVGQADEVAVGQIHQAGQGQTLGKFTELLAISRTDDFGQTAPAAGGLLLLI